MTRLNLALLILCHLTAVCFAQWYTTEDPDEDGDLRLNCTINNVNILNLPKGDPFLIDQVIYDNIKDTVLVPEEGTLPLGNNVSRIVVTSDTSNYVGVYTSTTSGTSRSVIFSVKPINEKTEFSRPNEHFYYNFTINVTCYGLSHKVDAIIPLHETNTYTPRFLKDVYEYTLYSSFPEDMERLLELEPIVANDDDISNTELKFFIQPNDYFELQYGDVVPGTLNKNHYARLAPKNYTINLPKSLTLTISTADFGYPSKSSNATLVIHPAIVKYPVFKQAFYVGDYYKNNTFLMRSQPQLQDVPSKYQIYAEILTDTGSSIFELSVPGNGAVLFQKRNWYDLDEITLYKYGYLAFTVSVTYIDTSSNNFQTQGNTTVIVELHPY